MPLFFMQNPPTPDTVSYLILGYVLMAVVGLGYLLSLLFRQRGLMRDLEVLAKLNEDEE